MAWGNKERGKVILYVIFQHQKLVEEIRKLVCLKVYNAKLGMNVYVNLFMV